MHPGERVRLLVECGHHPIREDAVDLLVGGSTRGARSGASRSRCAAAATWSRWRSRGSSRGPARRTARWAARGRWRTGQRGGMPLVPPSQPTQAPSMGGHDRAQRGDQAAGRQLPAVLASLQGQPVGHGDNRRAGHRPSGSCPAGPARASVTAGVVATSGCGGVDPRTGTRMSSFPLPPASGRSNQGAVPARPRRPRRRAAGRAAPGGRAGPRQLPQPPARLARHPGWRASYLKGNLDYCQRMYHHGQEVRCCALRLRQ